VLEDRSYRPSSSLEPFRQCLKCSFAAAPVPNAKMAVQRIEQLTGIRLSESQCRRTMKRLGMSLKKSAPLPGKVDEQLQLEFFTQEMAPRLEQAAKGERKVFFVDAAHFVLGAFLGQLDRRLASEAGARSGDDDYLARKSLQVSSKRRALLMSDPMSGAESGIDLPNTRVKCANW
jgi:hypothetical protein